jgi:hypothetical protein
VIESHSGAGAAADPNDRFVFVHEDLISAVEISYRNKGLKRIGVSIGELDEEPPTKD